MRLFAVVSCVLMLFLTGCPGGGTASSSPGNGSNTGGNSGGGTGGNSGGGSTQPISVTVAPQDASVPLNGSQQFSAAVANSASQAVSWSVVEGAAGGTVSSTGLYKAP